jgi:hypothetical protein
MYYRSRLLRRNPLLSKLAAVLVVVLVIASFASRTVIQHASHADFLSDPSGRITGLTPVTATTVPEYARFEAKFNVVTTATNPQLPYNPTHYQIPAQSTGTATDFYPDEDARFGITVNALLLPPGQSDWTQAEVQPAFWYEGYTATNVPTGEKDWHIRFAPNQTGTWQYRIQVTDAAGTATGTPATFNVTPSSNAGFLSVSRTDSRYFQFSDGTPLVATAGTTDDTTPANVGAVTLDRDWLKNIGLTASSSTGGGFYPNGTDISAQINDGQSRFSYGIDQPGGSNFGTPATSGHAVTFTTMLQIPGGSALTGSTVLDMGFYGLGGQDQKVAVQNTSAWQQVTLHIPASFPWNSVGGCGASAVNCHQFSLQLNNAATHPAAWADQYQLTDDASGELLSSASNWVSQYNQLDSNELDSEVENSETAATETYLELVAYQHDEYDTEYGYINADGTSASSLLATNSVGGSTSPTANTPVQRYQAAFARYLMARWGYSTALMGEEHVNEGDPNNGYYYAGALAFARAIHANTSDHRVLGTMDGWFANGAVNPYLTYANYADPNIDFVDYHDYVFASTSTNNLRSTGSPLSYRTGGPGNAGYVQLPIGSTLTIPINTLAGKGTWKVTYQYKTSADFAGGSASNWVQLSCDYVVCPSSSYDGAGGDGAGYKSFFPPTRNAVQTTWTTVNGTFAVPDTALHTSFDINMHANGLTSGTVDYSDIQLIAPNGKVWMSEDFSEPAALPADSVQYAASIGNQGETDTGQNPMGKPVVIGETDPATDSSLTGTLNTDLSTVSNTNTADLAYDPTDNFSRGFAWGEIGPTVSYPQFFGSQNAIFSAKGGWKYYAYVQKFLQNLPLANGKWGDVAATSTNANVRSVGQSDTVDGEAVVYTYNAIDTWDYLADGNTSQPQSTTLTIPGLPDGSYDVQRWDPGTGTVSATETDASAGGSLNVTISSLSQDVALKVFPAVTGSAAVKLAAPYRSSLADLSVGVSVSPAGQSAILAQAAGLATGSDGTVPLTPTAFAPGELTDGDSYDLSIMAPGYLPHTVTAVRRIFSSPPTATLVPGDFDGSDAIDLSDLVTSIRAYQGKTDAGAVLAQQTFGGTLNLADLVFMIAEYRAGTRGD